MTDYKEIKGKTVQSLGSDIANPSGEGQIWFNTAGSDYKTIVAVASWATGGNILTARDSGAVCGDKTAAILAGGLISDHSVTLAGETYDGSSWTETNDLNTARSRLPGMGSSTAGLTAGGWISSAGTALSEEYNGTSWAEGNALPVAKSGPGGAGTQTAGLTAGGGINTAGNVATSEVYDGTSWTEAATLNTSRGGSPGTGTQTAAFLLGGNYAPAPVSNPAPYQKTAIVEEYNGTSWTEVADLSVSRGWMAAAGTTSNALVWQGMTGPTPAGVNSSDTYDGSTWTTGVATPEVNSKGAGHGTTVGVAIGAGGYATPPPYKNTTLEYAFDTTLPPGAQNVKTITD